MVCCCLYNLYTSMKETVQQNFGALSFQALEHSNVRKSLFIITEFFVQNKVIVDCQVRYRHENLTLSNPAVVCKFEPYNDFKIHAQQPERNYLSCTSICVIDRFREKWLCFSAVRGQLHKAWTYFYITFGIILLSVVTFSVLFVQKCALYKKFYL